MREIIIKENDAGQRLDKFLFKYLKDAPNSFVYKMLRKKNITLNNKKSDGKDIIASGDLIKLFLSDETIEKFIGVIEYAKDTTIKSLYELMPEIVYEDDNIIIINKPKDMLSQRAEKNDISLNEIALSYLRNKGFISETDSNTFKPSVVNRLDRNTSGLIIFAKTYQAANQLSKALKDRTIHKYYKCICKGKIEKEILLKGHLDKDNEINRVSIKLDKASNIYTLVTPIETNGDITLVKVHLITGKTHQIRAHLASINHPLLGDYKYGDKGFNDYYKHKFKITSQLLCSYRIEMPEFDGILSYLSNKCFEIDVPTEFVKVCRDGNMEI